MWLISLLTFLLLSKPIYAVSTGVIVNTYNNPSNINENFNINYSISNASINTEYYAKIFTDPANNIKTFNSECLSNTNAWTSFPKITTDNEGKYTGDITACTDSELAAGDYNFKIKIALVSKTATQYSSSDNNITLNIAPLPTGGPTIIPTPTSTPSPTGGITPTDAPPTSEPTITNTPTPPPTGGPTPISNLYINEIMTNPDTGSEWVEIFNDNDFDIDLENYKIKDDTTHYRIISANTILAHSYYIFMFSNYLNNDKDSITLFDNYNRQIGETFSYTKTTKGYSYSLQEDDTWCLTTNSINQDNNSCYQEPTETPKPTSTTHPTSTPKNTPTPKTPKAPKSPKATSTPKPKNPPTGGQNSVKSKQIISKSTGFIPPQISLSPTAEVTSTTPVEVPKSNLISVLFLSFGGIFLLAPLFIV